MGIPIVIFAVGFLLDCNAVGTSDGFASVGRWDALGRGVGIFVLGAVDTVGLPLAEGLLVGQRTGSAEGQSLGMEDGSALGLWVGSPEGCEDGAALVTNGTVLTPKAFVVTSIAPK